jgi:glucokinase
MAAGQQAEQDLLDNVLLAPHDSLYVVADGYESRRELVCPRFVERWGFGCAQRFLHHDLLLKRRLSLCEPMGDRLLTNRSNTANHLCLAVDVGGTKLAAGVVDGTGRLRDRRAVPTVPDGSPADLFAVLAGLVRRFEPYSQFDVCGVGCGGPMTAGGDLVSPLNIPAWQSFPLRAELRRLTGLDTFVDNDAKALALGEGWVGAAAGERSYLAMVVSTGIGGGIVLDGRLLEGLTGNAGHIGHMVVASPGRALPHHVTGVLEAEASGTAIAVHTGRPAVEATTAEIAEVGTLVGRAAGSVANLLDLQLIVVAGSVALGYGEPFFAAAQAEVDRICQLDYSRGARIQPAGCGDEGPLVGAGAVGFRGIGLALGALAG